MVHTHPSFPLRETDNFITTLQPNDVLCGRGSGPNDNPGNIRFRALVATRKDEYLATTNRQRKAKIAREIVDVVYGFSPPGRFLRKADVAICRARGYRGDAWAVVNEETALEKAKQALRQNRGDRPTTAAAAGGGGGSPGTTSVPGGNGSDEGGSVGRSSVNSTDVTLPAGLVTAEAAAMTPPNDPRPDSRGSLGSGGSGGGGGQQQHPLAPSPRDTAPGSGGRPSPESGSSGGGGGGGGKVSAAAAMTGFLQMGAMSSMGDTSCGGMPFVGLVGGAAAPTPDRTGSDPGSAAVRAVGPGGSDDEARIRAAQHQHQHRSRWSLPQPLRGPQQQHLHHPPGVTAGPGPGHGCGPSVAQGQVRAQSETAGGGGQCRRSLMSRIPAAKNLPEGGCGEEAAAADEAAAAAVPVVPGSPQVTNLAQDFNRLGEDFAKLRADVRRRQDQPPPGPDPESVMSSLTENTPCVQSEGSVLLTTPQQPHHHQQPHHQQQPQQQQQHSLHHHNAPPQPGQGYGAHNRSMYRQPSEPAIDESSPCTHDHDDTAMSVGTIGTIDPSPLSSGTRRDSSYSTGSSTPSFHANRRGSEMSALSMGSMGSSTFSLFKGSVLMEMHESLKAEAAPSGSGGGGGPSPAVGGPRQHSGRYLANHRQDSNRTGTGSGYRQDSERFRQDSEKFRHELEKYRQDSGRYGVPRQDSSKYGVPRQDSDRSYALSQIMTGSIMTGCSTRKSIASEKSMNLTEILMEKRKGPGPTSSDPAARAAAAAASADGTEGSKDAKTNGNGGGGGAPRVGKGYRVPANHPALAEDPRPIEVIENDSDDMSFMKESSMRSMIQALDDSTCSMRSSIVSKMESRSSLLMSADSEDMP